MSWSLGSPLCFSSAERWKELECQRDGTLASGGERDWAQRSTYVKEYGALVLARAVRDLERSVTLSEYDHLRGQPHDPRGTIRGVQRDAGRRVKEGEREGASEQDDRFLPRRVFITQEVVRKFGPTPIAEKREQWLVTRLTNL